MAGPGFRILLQRRANCESLKYSIQKWNQPAKRARLHLLDNYKYASVHFHTELIQTGTAGVFSLRLLTCSIRYLHEIFRTIPPSPPTMSATPTSNVLNDYPDLGADWSTFEWGNADPDKVSISSDIKAHCKPQLFSMARPIKGHELSDMVRVLHAACDHVISPGFMIDSLLKLRLSCCIGEAAVDYQTLWETKRSEFSLPGAVGVPVYPPLNHDLVDSARTQQLTLPEVTLTWEPTPGWAEV
jgi:hypothetical protein